MLKPRKEDFFEYEWYLDELEEYEASKRNKKGSLMKRFIKDNWAIVLMGILLVIILVTLPIWLDNSKDSDLFVGSMLGGLILLMCIDTYKQIKRKRGINN